MVWAKKDRIDGQTFSGLKIKSRHKRAYYKIKNKNKTKQKKQKGRGKKLGLV